MRSWKEKLKELKKLVRDALILRGTLCRAVVSVPMVTLFNGIMNMNLKVWKDEYFPVLIDMVTGYCNACSIKRKTADVIDAVMRHWVALFGVHKNIIRDVYCSREAMEHWSV